MKLRDPQPPVLVEYNSSGIFLNIAPLFDFFNSDINPDIVRGRESEIENIDSVIEFISTTLTPLDENDYKVEMANLYQCLYKIKKLLKNVQIIKNV